MHQRSLPAETGSAADANRFDTSKKLKMKNILRTIILIFIISPYSCKPENTDSKLISNAKSEIADAKFISHVKSDLLKSIDRIFEQDGKFFLLKCRYFKNSERKRIREIKVNDKLFGVKYIEGNNIFTVKELNKDSITFSFISRDNYPEIYGVSEKEKIGEFRIKCSKKNEILTHFKIEGDEVNKQTALKHISEGKIYRLVELGNSNPKKLEENIYLQDCRMKAIEKFGYQNYYLDECLPYELFKRQLMVYNNTIFEYLKTSKKLKYKNFDQLDLAFRNEISDCNPFKYRTH